MDLEQKVLLLKLRISRFKIDFKKELEKETEKDKAIFMFDKDEPYLLKSKGEKDV
jgi:hypothetical protein